MLLRSVVYFIKLSWTLIKPKDIRITQIYSSDIFRQVLSVTNKQVTYNKKSCMDLTHSQTFDFFLFVLTLIVQSQANKGTYIHIDKRHFILNYNKYI